MAGADFSRRVLARVITAKLIAEPERGWHWMQALAVFLVEHHREAEAELIMNDVERELFQQGSQLSARVTSARPLTADARKSLIKLLTDRTDAKRVVLTEEIDPSLIGGLIARTPDAELDASIKTKLQRLAAIK